MKSCFEVGLKKEQYLLSTLPFQYQKTQQTNINTVAPKICQWLSDRVNGNEIYLNILLSFMYAVVLEIGNSYFYLGHRLLEKHFLLSCSWRSRTLVEFMLLDLKIYYKILFWGIWQIFVSDSRFRERRCSRGVCEFNSQFCKHGGNALS